MGTDISSQLLDLSENLKSVDAREKVILNFPGLNDIISAHVSSGGTIVDLCSLWKVRFGRIMGELNKSPEFRSMMNDANLARTEWFKEAILQKLKNISLVDVRLILNPNGSLKPVNEWPSDAARAVESIEVIETPDGGYVKRVKLHSATKALELLGKTMSMFSERVEITKAVTLVDILEASWKEESVAQIEPVR